VGARYSPSTRGEDRRMSKITPFSLSRQCNSDCTASGTALSHPCNTGSSYKKSYSLISSYRCPTGGPLGEITGEVEIETSASRTRAHRTARFLKGPVSLQGIAQAACLPGKALAVYLAIHHRCDLESSRTITLPAMLLAQFGVNRNAKARALRHLERAGLVRVERKAGGATRISLPVSNAEQP
jgi:hypothetical protein